MQNETHIESLKDEVHKKIKKSLEFLASDLLTLRTGRANKAMLDNIKVDYYGNMVAVEQVGTITVPDPRMIIISVWEKNIVFSLETAIRKSKLGINPIVDGNKIKLPIPPLTEDLRKGLVKKSTEYGENAKIAIRQIRKHFIDDLKNLQKNKIISEDEYKIETGLLEKIIKNAIYEVDTILDSKNKELMSI